MVVRLPPVPELVITLHVLQTERLTVTILMGTKIGVREQEHILGQAPVLGIPAPDRATESTVAAKPQATFRAIKI